MSTSASALTTGPLTVPNNLFTGVSTSTLLSTQTAIPTERRPFGCGGGFETVDTLNPACSLQAFNQSAVVLQRCCNGAPRVVFASNCNIYCNAQGQSLEALANCISRNFNGSIPGGMLCNRAGVSYSEIVPTRTAPPQTVTPSTAAAPIGMPNALRYDGTGISYAAWGTVAMLALSGFAGMLL